MSPIVSYPKSGKALGQPKTREAAPPGGSRRPGRETGKARPMKEPDRVNRMDITWTPAFLVDRDLRIVSHNHSFMESFLWLRDKPRGLWAGEILECQNASVAECCGAALYCVECAIRRTVVGTFKTGVPQRNVPASIFGKMDGRIVRREFLISTEKLGNQVMVAIESLITVLEPPQRET